MRRSIILFIYLFFFFFGTLVRVSIRSSSFLFGTMTIYSLTKMQVNLKGFTLQRDGAEVRVQSAGRMRFRSLFEGLIVRTGNGIFSAFSPIDAYMRQLGGEFFTEDSQCALHSSLFRPHSFGRAVVVRTSKDP